VRLASVHTFNSRSAKNAATWSWRSGQPKMGTNRTTQRLESRLQSQNEPRLDETTTASMEFSASVGSLTNESAIMLGMLGLHNFPEMHLAELLRQHADHRQGLGAHPYAQKAVPPVQQVPHSPPAPYLPALLTVGPWADLRGACAPPGTPPDRPVRPVARLLGRGVIPARAAGRRHNQRLSAQVIWPTRRGGRRAALNGGTPRQPRGSPVAPRSISLVSSRRAHLPRGRLQALSLATTRRRARSRALPPQAPQAGPPRPAASEPPRVCPLFEPLDALRHELGLVERDHPLR
jgi:hypothetical protein